MAELKIDVSKLRGKSLFLATPMFGGMCNTNYMSSVLRLQDQCVARGIQFSHCFIANESLIDRARNTLVHEFIQHKESTHFLFIDADIQFEPDDVFAMMSFDKELICAPYPKKQINWSVIRKAIEVNPNISNPELNKLIGEYVFTPLETDAPLDACIKVAEAGTGFMLIRRDLFERMQAYYLEDYYISDDSNDVRAGKKKEMHAFFKTGIVDNRYLSEDYMFCHNWRKMGGDVWLFPWAQTTHFGTYGFQGSVGQLVNTMRMIEEKQKNDRTGNAESPPA